MKVIGIGNALVDIMTSLENDDLLEILNLPKGSMQIVDDETIEKAIEQTIGLKQTLASGGSAANTINGLANLGVVTGFIGKVGKDEMGDFFNKDMTTTGISPSLLIGTAASGRALALVSTDSERTFAVNLGAAIEMLDSDIEESSFQGYNFLHIEGYLVQNHALIEKSIKTAKQAGLKISLDLASYNVVEANLEFLKRIVSEYVDVVFANEDEAKAFTGKSPEQALVEISKMVDIAVVKIGAEGSLIKSGEEVVKMGVINVNAIDSTGAGDLFAAGFIYGLTKNLTLKQCAEIGAILSGKVIEVIGPKMDAERWDTIRSMVDKIVNGDVIIK
ncbi:MAG: adenosine kinase [Bacteroidales bacterium]